MSCGTSDISQNGEEEDSEFISLILSLHEQIEQNKLDKCIIFLNQLIIAIKQLEYIQPNIVKLIEDTKILFDLLVFFDETCDEQAYQSLCFLSQLAYVSDDIVQIIFKDQLLFKYIQRIRSGSFGADVNGQLLRLIGACAAVDSQIRYSIRDHEINDVILNGLNDPTPKIIEDTMFCITEFIRYCKNDIGLSYFNTFLVRIVEILEASLDSEQLSSLENIIYLCTFFFHTFNQSSDSINVLRANNVLPQLLEILKKCIELVNPHIQQFAIGAVISVITYGEADDAQLVFSLIDPSIILTCISSGDYVLAASVLKYINSVLHLAPEIIDNAVEQGLADLMYEVLLGAQGYLKNRFCEVLCEMIIILCQSTVSSYLVRDEFVDLIIDTREIVKMENDNYSSYDAALQKLLLCTPEDSELYGIIVDVLE